MQWNDLGTFTLNEEWQFTTSVKAELFCVTHLSYPIKQDYVKAVISQVFQESSVISIFNPQRLSCRNEKEIFNFSSSASLEKSIGFKRLDKASDIIWKIKIEYQDMLIPSSKPQITNALPLADISINNVKKLVIPEKLDGSRRNYLINNLGSQTVYFKYVPLGTDPAAETLIVSATNYDFLLSAGDKWLDNTLSQNGVVGITTNVLFNTKLKVVEYLYL